MRIIPTSVHGVMDYLVGILLIAAPWLFGFALGGAETWTPVVIGIVIILQSLMTNYELGAVPVLSVPAHLTMDVLAGALLALSPWLFGFADYVWVPHVVMGVLDIGAGLMTETTPRRKLTGAQPNI